MNWIKIAIINLFVFILLLLFLEISMRVVWTSYSCFIKNCDLSRISKFSIYEDFIENDIGISKYSSDLGYIPNPGFIGNIEASGWENKYVSINDKGFRDNGHVFKKGELDTKRKILAVGDSFTFGDQVNDQETWPACVEKETKRATLNGGVFGYGVAQAVKRASITVKDETIDTLILSIFINNGFHRDQLKFRSGFPRPAVISSNGKQLFAS